ncbi:MAG: hypothetical protein PHR29_04875 [Acholeplasmataceae bacterium]|nr:hypothetical protein [Acholeplasmataceae bacterium]
MADLIVYDSLGAPEDTASATGSLHAKVRNLSDVLLATKYRTIASDNQRANLDEVVWQLSEDFAKTREIQMCIGGSIRVAFDLRAYDSSACSAQIRVNNIAAGAEWVTYDKNTWTTYTEDISLKEGSYLQIFIKATNGGFGYIQNLRIYYDKVAIDPTDEFVVIL